MTTAHPALIYHLAEQVHWDPAVASGTDYRRSTLGRSLNDVGFIHCSFARQAQSIADLVYRGRNDIVLLEIDTTRLSVEVRVENLDGGTDLFPHLYGPLSIPAVTRATAVPCDADGRLRVEELLDDT